jgi:tRNA pseudouridine55 synthase
MITKKTKDLSECDFQSGEVILINKPSLWSSFKVVNFIRKVIGVKKVGHAGTLDPSAEGLLIVCTGKKTKSISEFQELPKTYRGIITLGITTPSMDLETDVIATHPLDKITLEDIEKARNKFIGEIEQLPPMYSAIKKNGTRLYKLAREGKTIKREPRKVTVYSFNIFQIEIPDVFFEISCSKGTYIRVIANDFGNLLGCGGILSSLNRTKIGDFSAADALTLKEFKNLAQSGVEIDSL